MPYLPQIAGGNTSRHVTDAWYGYNHNMKIGQGEFYDTKNLTTKHFPMLATRPRRGLVQKLANPQGLLAKDKLAYIDDGVLYYDGEATPVTVTPGHKHMLSMGAYICVFPDNVYYNTQDPADYGNMDYSQTFTQSVTYTPCSISGADYTYTSSASAPSKPTNGQYWYDTTAGSLKRYSAPQGDWVTIATVYTKIQWTGFEDISLTDIFKEYDGINISGTSYPEILDGQKVLYAVGPDYIVVIGMIEGVEPSRDETDITLSRTVPKLDFVIECQNRLWGCYYGQDENGKTLNEVYCSALGDFKNWRQYMGLSTDSWTASVGSDGPWTGAINYLGYPTFFKETVVHRVSISASGAHSMIEQALRGVQAGSGDSLAIVNEMLLYKTRTDVCAYQGGFPEEISSALGDLRYSEAVGGAFGNQYYISIKGEDGNWNLFVFDIGNRLWIKEDDLHLTDIVAVADSLYALDADGNLWDLTGYLGEKEETLPWMAQTGVLYYEYPDRKYVSRYDIRLSAQKGTKLDIFLQYDSDGIWHPQGHVHFKGLNTVTFPVRPRRCDHLELRLTGDGEVKLFSIARILEQGSDM